MEFLNLILLVLLISATIDGRYMPKQCVKVRTNMCKRLDPKHYMWTSFPNFMNQTSYEQVNHDMDYYQPIIDSRCSVDMPIFLCAIYVPICRQGVSMRIPPCRSLCESAKMGCQPLLPAGVINWPESMRCDQFPEDDGQTLCISPKKQEENTVVRPHIIPTKRKNSNHKISITFYFKKKIQNKNGSKIVLSCGPEKKIAIRKVRFFPHHTANCCPSLALSFVNDSCMGKNKCVLDMSQVIQSATCSRHVTAVRAKYKCVDEDKPDQYFERRSCNHNV